MSTAAISCPTPVRQISGLSRFANLLGKEWRESRAMILVGSCVFFGMPLLWGVVYLLLDNMHQPGLPFGLVLTLLVGWLYAVVAGAHTVCRDWGRPEESFLLARPVSPRVVIGAKLLSGLILLGTMIVMAGMADILTFLLPKALSHTTNLDDLRGMRGVLGISLLVLIGSYVIAFAAAVMTRQMLTSTLVAILVLVVWVCAPMIFQPLTVLHPVQQLAYTSQTGQTNLPFLCAVVFCVGSAVVLSFAAAGWERTFNLGHKALAWVFAAVILVLFGGAMFEVGNSLTVLDAAVVPKGTGFASNQFPSDWLWTSSGDRALAMSRSDRVVSAPDKKGWISYKSIATFSVDAKGRIQDLRRAALCYSPNPGPTQLEGIVAFHKTNLLRTKYISDFGRTREGDLVVHGVWDSGVPDRVFEMRIRWPKGEDPQVRSLAVSAFEGETQDALGYARWDRVLLRFATTSRHAYVEYAIRGNKPSAVSPFTLPRAMYVYTWPEGDGLDRPVGPARIINENISEFRDWLESSEDGLAIKDLGWHGPVEFNEGQVSIPGEQENREVYPGEYGPALSPGTAAGDQMQILQTRQAIEATIDSAGAKKIVWDPRGLAMVSDQNGLRVFKPSPDGAELVGQNRASLLSMGFRNRIASLQTMSRERLAEVAWSGLNLYDTSDAAHPRRLGFFNLRGWSPQALEVNGFLVLRQILGVSQQEQLLVLDRVR